MIVDDSIVARAVLSRILAATPDLRPVAEAGSSAGALALLDRTTVDVILLDLEMPGQNGLAALPALIARSGARVLIVSGSCQRGATASIEAMRLGAADTLLKPGVAALGDGFARALVERLRRIADPATGGAAGAEGAAAAPVPLALQAPPAPRTPVACVAIGASTGGVHALAAFFAAYPAAAAAPILVTQHLPPPFMAPFARQLAAMAGRRAIVAEDGMALAADTILLAPGDAHLGLVAGGSGAAGAGGARVRLDRSRAASGCIPSVDPMFAAVARLFGPCGVGLLLSGMGRDGLEGAHALVAAGGEVAVQDAASSVVWGMPGAVARAGLAAAMLPPAALAARVAARQCGGERAPNPAETGRWR